MESPNITNTNLGTQRQTSAIDRFAKRFVLQALNHISVGHLTLEDGGKVFTFGESLNTSDYVAHIKVHHSAFYRDIFFNRSIGAGESYMKNNWSSPDLLKTLQLMTKNLAVINHMDHRQPVVSRLIVKLLHLFNKNTANGSRKNIAAHYDLGNDFFALFLDPTMMYSSAIFSKKDTSLEEAAVNKLDVICQKLDLQPGDHLLEIGTGWGGLAVHAAQNYGCRVTTTTISKEQYAYAKKSVEKAGLSDRITLLLEDYRDLEGQYDKLVSIEMIEAVGHQYYNSYFEQCDKLLKPDGLLLIQAITIADQRYLDAKASVDFIQKYIFPGGSLPSVEVISKCTANETSMQVIHLDDITEHYADTLMHWRNNFLANLDQVKQQGFDSAFQRMWEFYLCYCEGGFRERAISTVQLLLAKPNYRFKPN